MYGGINRSFSGHLRLSVIFLLSGQSQLVISPDNRGSNVFLLIIPGTQFEDPENFKSTKTIMLKLPGS
jgi:hypothetical protein